MIFKPDFKFYPSQVEKIYEMEQRQDLILISPESLFSFDHFFIAQLYNLKKWTPPIYFFPYLCQARDDGIRMHSVLTVLQSMPLIPGEKLFLDVHCPEIFESYQPFGMHNIPAQFFIDRLPLKQDDHVIFPDMGARLRYSVKNSFTACRKTRNQDTGKIDELDVYGADFTGRDCWIIDDICDGGRTFIEISEKIRAKCKSLKLAVTHGIFSRSERLLLDHFDEVWTTDSFKIQNHQINTIQSEDLLNDYLKAQSASGN